MLDKFACALSLCLLAMTGVARSGELIPGFVYLADVAPSIRQDMRYAGSHNFIGRPIAGYEANECILTARAADALAQVQIELNARGLSLVVWDCYRPVRAVRDFIAWSKVPGDARMKAEFFPNTDKANFFKLGYLASRSAHSRGSTVDLGIVPNSVEHLPKFNPAAPLRPCTAAKGERFEDETIDFGTEHDCLDPLASTNSPNVTKEARANRLLLQKAMQRTGFKPYSREWWHFELIDEPFPQQAGFDFPVVARGGSQADDRTPPREPTEIDKPQRAPPIGWIRFRHGVLHREANAVASMTRFPFTRASEQLSQDAFVNDFRSIFDGDVTACIARQTPEQTPKLGKTSYSLTCSAGGKTTTLSFQTSSGNWRLIAIDSENEADEGTRPVVEKGRPEFQRGHLGAEKGRPASKQKQ